MAGAATAKLREPKPTLRVHGLWGHYPGFLALIEGQISDRFNASLE